MTKSRGSSDSVKLLGAQEPSAKTAPTYNYSDVGDALSVLRAGHMTLDEWQRNVLEDWMGRTPGGLWAAPVCGGSVPRQNGKTAVIQARIASGMILLNEQVIYTAHLQKTSTETFEGLRDFFETASVKKYVAEIKSALGREEIKLKSGARVKFLARTRNGGRGQHGDLLVFDEAQELDEASQASFLPAISASINPQTVYAGTPPDPTALGVVFGKIRERGLSGNAKGLAWFEFSVPEIGDISDPARWAATNPALGIRILLSTIQSELEQMDEDTFARERLGWWKPPPEEKPLDMAIDPKAWDACASAQPKPEGKTAYGIKFSIDGAEVVLCGAVCPTDGAARVSMIERRSTAEGVQWLAEWLNQRYTRACCVVIDGRNGVDVLIDRIAATWRMKGSIVRPSARDMIAAVSTLTTEIDEQTVTWYKEQAQLRDSALSATKRNISGGWGFGGANSAPIEAAALALWGCRNSKRDPTKKMRIG